MLPPPLLLQVPVLSLVTHCARHIPPQPTELRGPTAVTLGGRAQMTAWFHGSAEKNQSLGLGRQAGNLFRREDFVGLLGPPGPGNWFWLAVLIGLLNQQPSCWNVRVLMVLQGAWPGNTTILCSGVSCTLRTHTPCKNGSNGFRIVCCIRCFQ